MDGQDVMGWRSDTAAAARSLARHSDRLRGLMNSIDAILPRAVLRHAVHSRRPRGDVSNCPDVTAAAAGSYATSGHRFRVLDRCPRRSSAPASLLDRPLHSMRLRQSHLRRIVRAVYSASTHRIGIGSNESIRPRHRQGRGVRWSITPAARSIMLV